MKVTRHNITTALGASPDWEKVPGITKQNAEDLNIIGYKGELNGQRTTLYKYLEELSKSKVFVYDLDQTSFDTGDFLETYSLVVVHMG